MNKPHQSTNKKFRGKYRIPSARLKNYDYASNGAYFITICTKNREHFFGQVAGGEMHLSNIGEIIADEWKKTAEIRENVELGEWVVMPNHVHGILISPGNPDFTIASFVMKMNCIVFLNILLQILPIGKMMIIIDL